MGPARERARPGCVAVRDHRHRARLPKRPAVVPQRNDRASPRRRGRRATRPRDGAPHQPALLDPVCAGGREGPGVHGGWRVRKVRRVVAVAGLVLAGMFWSAGPASAHPLGNFTINLYSGLVVEPGRLQVNYVLDMAEIPTFQEMPRIDTNDDGTASPAERAAFAEGKAGQLVEGVTATVDGRPVALRVVSSSMRFRPGQGGLPILRLEAEFAGPLPKGGTLEYREGNYSGHIGWREITAVGADG